MGDLLTVLHFIDKLEYAKLVPTEEVDQISKHLLESLKELVGPYRYEALFSVLDSSDGDSTNPLYIHLTK